MIIPGQVFNPFRLFYGVYIPNWLVRQGQVTFGAKVLYGRLIQFAGENGKCFPALDLIASELGISQPMISKYVKELKSFNLIQVKRCGLGRSNEYFFLWHEWMEGETQEEIKGRKFRETQKNPV